MVICDLEEGDRHISKKQSTQRTDSITEITSGESASDKHV